MSCIRRNENDFERTVVLNSIASEMSFHLTLARFPSSFVYLDIKSIEMSLRAAAGCSSALLEECSLSVADP